MTALHHIHEAGILHNLGERSKLKDQRPYTFMVNFPCCTHIGGGADRLSSSAFRSLVDVLGAVHRLLGGTAAYSQDGRGGLVERCYTRSRAISRNRDRLETACRIKQPFSAFSANTVGRHKRIRA